MNHKLSVSLKCGHKVTVRAERPTWPKGAPESLEVTAWLHFSKKVLAIRSCICAILRMCIDRNTKLLDELKRWFLDGAEELWPIALGSLSLRKSPCIRKQCSACASGHGHLSYALSGYQGKRRFSIYVPDELAPEIEKAIENGRQLQELMKEAGLRYIKERKRARQEKR